jgi:hypothetical protein
MSPTPHLRMETDPVSEMLRSLEYGTMGKVKNPVITNVAVLKQTCSGIFVS